MRELLSVIYYRQGELSRNLLSEACRDFNLNQTTLLTLYFLYKGSEEGLTPKSLAHLLCCQMSRVSSQLAALKRRKLISERKAPKSQEGETESEPMRDRRQVFYLLTKTGEKTARSLLSRLYEVEKLLLKLTTEKQRMSMEKMLRTLEQVQGIEQNAGPIGETILRNAFRSGSITPLRRYCGARY